MKINTILAAVAASSLMVVQPAAAATRSYESLPVSGAHSNSAVNRAASAVAESEAAAGSSLWLVFAALGLTGVVAALAAGGKSAVQPGQQSPG